MNASLLLTLLFVLCSLAEGASFGSKDLPKAGDLPDGGKLWALLVAGSKFFTNYRHQADVCHAYQIVHSHGIPDENIVVMMYDDIAHNDANPRPGVIINRPNGSDVYHGVPHDYTGAANSPENFLRVLEGVPSPENNVHKVIASGPKDHVFVYFADHGAPGLIAFGDDILKATDLMKTIQRKNAKKGYGKMVFYIEACESGSMFEDLLPDNINVFATTAANSTTSSYACYFDADLQTYLGDVYSVKWLEDSDAENLKVETLESQFDIVRDETTTSQVCEFGDLSISKMPVSEFQGLRQSKPSVADEVTDDNNEDPCLKDAVPSGEVPRILLEKKLGAAKTLEELVVAEKNLHDYLNYRRSMDNKMRAIIHSVTSDEEKTAHMLSATRPISNHTCYYQAVDAFHASCYNLGRHEYGLRLVYGLANLCRAGYSAGDIVAAIEDHCLVTPNIEVY